MVLVLYLILIRAALSLPVNGTQICLTWNVRENHLVLNCKVFSFKYKLLVEDPFHQIRAECFRNRFPYCVVNRKEDMVFDHLNENDFSVVLKTGKQNADGKWKCYHENNEANVNISISSGNVYSADVHLKGEAFAVKDKIHFNLSCFSCWIPYTKSVYFLVNGVLEDNVRYHDGKCYHKRKACSQTECTCSKEGNNFTWSYITTLSYLEFGCEMQFNDEETSTMSIHTTNSIYNGSVFQADINRTRTILSTDKVSRMAARREYANGEKTGDIIKNVVLTMTTIILISLPALQCLFPEMRGRITQWILRCYRRKLLDLEGRGRIPFTKYRSCYTCAGSSVCAICEKCRAAYCNVCFDAHTKWYPDHNICKIHAVARSKIYFLCDRCSKKKADQLCKTCFRPLCKSCAKTHKHKMNMIRIYLEPPRRTKQAIKYQYNVSLNKRKSGKTVSICGLTYIEDGRIVLLERNNYDLIVFKLREESFRLCLKNEPRALTAMNENQVAVTFTYIRQIQIYKIVQKSILYVENIFLPDLVLQNLKIFSIAYDYGIFAVKMGIGYDGMIIIMDKGSVHAHIPVCKRDSLVTTGHTIRLALKVKTKNPLEGLVFVSSINRRVVYCVDFEGNTIWTVSVPSPRDIIVVPQDCIPGKDVVLCSKLCSVIYGLSKDDGCEEVLLAKRKIKSPKYISYNSIDRLLCISTVTEYEEDELAVFYVTPKTN